MSRNSMALIAAVLAAVAWSGRAEAQLFKRSQARSDAATSKAAGAPAAENPTAGIPNSRSARHLLRTGLDYLDTYGDPARALPYLKEADAKKAQLTEEERYQLAQAIMRAEKQRMGLETASKPVQRRAPSPLITTRERGRGSVRRDQPMVVPELPADPSETIASADPMLELPILPVPTVQNDPLRADRQVQTAGVPDLAPAPVEDTLPPIEEATPSARIEEMTPPATVELQTKPAPALPEHQPTSPAPAAPHTTEARVEPRPASSPAPLGPKPIGLTIISDPRDQIGGGEVAAAPTNDRVSPPVDPDQPAAATRRPVIVSDPVFQRDDRGGILLVPPTAARQPQAKAFEEPQPGELELPALPERIEPSESSAEPVAATAPAPLDEPFELPVLPVRAIGTTPSVVESEQAPPTNPMPMPRRDPMPEQDPKRDLPEIGAPAATEPATVIVPPEIVAPGESRPSATPIQSSEPKTDVSASRPATAPEVPEAPSALIQAAPIDAEMPPLPIPGTPLIRGEPEETDELPALPRPGTPSARAEVPEIAEELPAREPPASLPVRIASREGDTLLSPRMADPGPDRVRILRSETMREVEELARRQDTEERQRMGLYQPSSSRSASETQAELPKAPSPTEARPINPIPMPEEFVPLERRDFPTYRKYWAAAATCHAPLYFQDAVLERYGQGVEQALGPHWGRFFSYPVDDPRQTNQRNQLLQPAYSAGMFALQLATWPFNMVMNPPWEAEYDLGYYRPGDPIPPDTYYWPKLGVGPPLRGRKY